FDQRIAERVGDFVPQGRRRRDEDLMRLAALARQRSGGEMKLLVREQHRFRVAVCGIVLDPIVARAVLTHAATLVCGRSPACTKNRWVSSSEMPWTAR